MSAYISFQASLYSFLSVEQDYWIGLADFANEGIWIWQHSYQDTNYTFWASGEPNSDGNEDCGLLVCAEMFMLLYVISLLKKVFFQHASSSFAWNDGDCNAEQVYDGIPNHALCEADNV